MVNVFDSANSANGKSEDFWLVAQVEEDGVPTIYRVRDKIPAHVDIGDYPYLISVVWPYDGEADNGMPGDNVKEHQTQFEDALDPFVEKGGDNEHMVVVTGKGRKEWLWYAKDADRWIEEFSAALHEYPAFPVEIQGYAADEWRSYKTLREALKASQKD